MAGALAVSAVASLAVIAVALVKINQNLAWQKAVLVPWINALNNKLGLPK